MKSAFLRLCDLASDELRKDGRPFQEADRTSTDPTTHHTPFFEDAYAVRALCAAYDVTGKTKYLKTCQLWADKVLTFQGAMSPLGAYYMNYYREPGADDGEWFIADSGCIGMAVLATAVRTRVRAARHRYLNSVKAFTHLVMDNYIGPNGGVKNGLWSVYDGEWWCSTSTFGALLYLLYQQTGHPPYKTAALRALDWLVEHALWNAEFALGSAPAIVFYCGEFYATVLRHLSPSTKRRKAVDAQIVLALEWLAANQKGRAATTSLNYSEATYMAGMPYLMYVYARTVKGGRELKPSADKELRYLGRLLFDDGSPDVTQLAIWELTTWAMMSYAERRRPGALFRNSDG